VQLLNKPQLENKQLENQQITKTLNPHAKKWLPQTKASSSNIVKKTNETNSISLTDYDFYYKQKYLKYKQKYLKLKAMI
jgi:predicted Zn-dependent protease